MKIYYFSFAHIAYILSALVLCFFLYLTFRKRSKKLQGYVVLTLAVINALQHLLKSFIYPHYIELGLGFTALSTAYNMCAFLILLSPIVYFIKSQTLRDFIYLIGTSAGILALLIPYWNIGDSAFSFEVIRFFICHALLLSSSVLPLLFGLHKPSYKSFYKLGLCFFAAVVIIIANDAFCVAIGIYPGIEGLTLTEALYRINPVWSFGPPDAFSFIIKPVKLLSPNVWVFDNPTGLCYPVLWYLIPLYLAVTVIAFPICVFADYNSFCADLREKRKKN